MSLRLANCCTARKTRSTPMLVTPVSRSAKSMKTVKWFGKSRATQHLFQAEQAQRAVQSQAQNRVPQSQDTGQGRIPISGDQTSVWLCESALSRTDEKHRSIDHAVCLVQFVDGSKKADGYGLITRVTRRNGLTSSPRRRVRDISRSIAPNSEGFSTFLTVAAS